jgi:hypothetical protein
MDAQTAYDHMLRIIEQVSACERGRREGGREGGRERDGKKERDFVCER